jgi:hypothetical protein
MPMLRRCCFTSQFAGLRSCQEHSQHCGAPLTAESRMKPIATIPMAQGNQKADCKRPKFMTGILTAFGVLDCATLRYAALRMTAFVYGERDRDNSKGNDIS